jgi:hypothetical protein
MELKGVAWDQVADGVKTTEGTGHKKRKRRKKIRVGFGHFALRYGPILQKREEWDGHEKHENPAAHEALKAPIGARKVFVRMTRLFWCFLWPKISAV